MIRFNRLTMRILFGFCLGAVFVTGNPDQARAQASLKIAAVVNDEAISEMDVYSRAKLMMVSSGAQDSPETRQRMVKRALEDLIDESLQLQEAKRLELEIPDDEVQQAFAGIAQQNGMTGEQFEQALQQSGVGAETLKRQIRSKLAWVQAIRSIYAAKIDVSEGEIDAALAETAAQAAETGVEYEISEIFLPVSDPNLYAQVESNAQELINRLRAGENFASLAQQYSRSASSATGGAVGWVKALALPAEIASALERMGPGQVSTPLRTKNGIYLVRLENRRRNEIANSNNPDAGKAELHLKQIFVPVTSDMEPARVEYMRRVADTARTRLSGCNSISSVLREFNLKDYSELGWMKEDDLPSRLAGIVKALPVDQPSQTMRLQEGYAVLMVCERRTIPGEQPERDDVTSRLRSEKLELMARRHLRDLKRLAIIDVRMQ